MANKGQLSNVQVLSVPRVGRRMRRPEHRFQLKTRPYSIVPFMIAPTLPGDTLENVLLQARVVSDGIKNPLIGWHKEYYFFYVSHRALASADAGLATELQALMLDPTATISAPYRGVASTPLYKYNNGVDYLGYAVKAIVTEFFKDQDETVTAGQVDSPYYAAQIKQTSWLDSVMNEDTYEAQEPAAVPLVDGDDANTTLDAHELEALMRQYELLRDMKLTDATYEDFLRLYGVHVPDKIDTPVPELLRYVRQWTYPANTPDSSGNVGSVVSWSIAERADKKRFFKEPGFIVGLTVARPKIYMSNQLGAAVSMLDNVKDWLHPMLVDDIKATYKEFAAGAGPLPNNTDGYYVDVKDLFLYGDQFVNFALTDTDKNLVALPTAGLGKKYASATDIDGLFKNAAGGFKYLREDGVVSLNIASRVVDTSAKV